MLKKLVLTIMVSMFAVASFAQALEMGARELILQGDLDFDNAEGNVDWTLLPGIGYFFMDNVEIGPLGFLGYDGDDMGYGIGGFVEYNIDLDMALVPYLTARGMYRFGDYFPENHSLGEAAVGMKVFLSDAVAVAGEVFYDYATEKIFINNEKLEKNDAGMRVGVRCFF